MSYKSLLWQYPSLSVFASSFVINIGNPSFSLLTFPCNVPNLKFLIFTLGSPSNKMLIFMKFHPNQTFQDFIENILKQVSSLKMIYPANIYLLKFSSTIGNVLVFLLLTLNIFTSFSSVNIVDFDQVNVCWVLALRSGEIDTIALNYLTHSHTKTI